MPEPTTSDAVRVLRPSRSGALVAVLIPGVLGLGIVALHLGQLAVGQDVEPLEVAFVLLLGGAFFGAAVAAYRRYTRRVRIEIRADALVQVPLLGPPSTLPREGLASTVLATRVASRYGSHVEVLLLDADGRRLASFAEQPWSEEQLRELSTLWGARREVLDDLVMGMWLDRTYPGSGLGWVPLGRAAAFVIGGIVVVALVAYAVSQLVG